MTASRLGRCTLLMALLLCGIPSRIASAAPSVADAKRALESATASLTKAIERIKVDPPSVSDLDAAQTAVGALKVAIDAGAEMEAKDLDYAKAALAARKELRIQREYVEERRSKVHVHESRRTIDAAMAKLGDAAARLDGKPIGDKDFEAVRTAAAQVRTLLEQGQPFVAQDPAYAKYTAEVKATVAKHESAALNRETALAIEKQKAAVEPKRQALAAALGALDPKAATDAQFEATESAAAALGKALDDGKASELKDKSYKSWADQVRDEIKQARKRSDGLWSATGLARLKAEIEPAKSDLVAATKALRSKSATTEQVAEARTAAIVVQKLVEKYDAIAGRSGTTGLYLAEVKKILLEVEVDLQRRAVEPTRAAVAAAMKVIGDRKVEEAAFTRAEAEVKGALLVLSAGERLEKLDRTYASYAQELGKKLKEAQAAIAARRLEVTVLLQRTALESAQGDVSRALKSLEKRAPSDEDFQEAKTALVVLEKTIETATAKDVSLAKLVTEMQALLKTARASLEARRLALDLEQQKQRIEAGRSEIASLLGKIAGSKVPDEKLKAVDDAIARVRSALADGAALITKDKGYEAYDREVKKRLEEAAAKLSARRDELAVETQRAKVEPLLKELTRALDAIDGLGKKAQLIDAAEKAMHEAEGSLASGTSLESRIPSYGAWVKEAKRTFDAARARIGKKRLEVAVGDGRAELEARLASAVANLEAVKPAEAAERELTTAVEAIKAVAQAIEQRASLEKDDKGYATAAAKARAELARLEQGLDLARRARALRKATGEVLTAAVASAETAAKSTDIRAQKEAYERAVGELKNCQRNGERLLEETPTLSNILVLALGQRLEPKAVLGLCAEHQAAVEELLKKVIGLVTFEDGPKRFYQAAKAKLAQSPNEALGQFEECVSSGKVLEYKSPELKDRKFDVAGGKMTLSELVAACVAEAKRLQKK